MIKYDMLQVSTGSRKQKKWVLEAKELAPVEAGIRQKASWKLKGLSIWSLMTQISGGNMTPLSSQKLSYGSEFDFDPFYPHL